MDRIANICCGHVTCQNEVRGLLAQAWEEGREAGLRDYDDRMPDHSPNPYTKED